MWRTSLKVWQCSCTFSSWVSVVSTHGVFRLCQIIPSSEVKTAVWMSKAKRKEIETFNLDWLHRLSPYNSTSVCCGYICKLFIHLIIQSLLKHLFETDQRLSVFMADGVMLWFLGDSFLQLFAQLCQRGWSAFILLISWRLLLRPVWRWICTVLLMSKLQEWIN